MFDKIKEDIRETLKGRTRHNDLRARLHADHVEISAWLADLRQTADPERREDLRDQIVDGLRAHATAEAEVVYGFFETHPHPRVRTVKSHQEHADMERMVQQLASVDCAGPALAEMAREMRSALTYHVHLEETDVLPQAEAAYGVELLATLITPFEARKLELMIEAADRLWWTTSVDHPARTGGLEESNSQF